MAPSRVASSPLTTGFRNPFPYLLATGEGQHERAAAVTATAAAETSSGEGTKGCGEGQDDGRVHGGTSGDGTGEPHDATPNLHRASLPSPPHSNPGQMRAAATPGAKGSSGRGVYPPHQQRARDSWGAVDADDVPSMSEVVPSMSGVIPSMLEVLHTILGVVSSIAEALQLPSLSSKSQGWGGSH